MLAHNQSLQKVSKFHQSSTQVKAKDIQLRESSTTARLAEEERKPVSTTVLWKKRAGRKDTVGLAAG